MTAETDELRSELIELGLSSGLSAVGVCDADPFLDVRRVLNERRDLGLNADMAFTYRNPERSTDPGRTLPSARSMIVGAYRYDTTLEPEPPGTVSHGPHARVARYATNDHYGRLRSSLRLIAEVLKERGHRGVVVADDNAMVDRAVAVRAGLGWYGKSANVLLPGQGSWFVLGSVITDVEFEPTGTPLGDGCGSCRACMDGCPTGAIIAPGVVDAGRCLSWQLQAGGDFPREFREALGDRIYGCDDCQEVCPPSRRADNRGIGAPESSPAGEGWVDVAWMLAASDDELLGELGRWYIARRDPRYLRRNALVVYGNTGGGRSVEEHERVLGPYLDGEDEMLTAHAAWAVDRLGSRDLLNRGGRGDRRAILDELGACGVSDVSVRPPEDENHP